MDLEGNPYALHDRNPFVATSNPLNPHPLKHAVEGSDEYVNTTQQWLRDSFANIGDDLDSGFQHVYINPFTFDWEVSTTSYSGWPNFQSAYLCEERGVMVTNTYKRLHHESPMVTRISPASGPPGTLITIEGKNFNVTAESGDPNNVTVMIGSTPCVVLHADAHNITCHLRDECDAGIYPLRVWTSLGASGPAALPRFTVVHEVYNMTPAVGSIGGGQLIRLDGVNFPTDKSVITVTMTSYISVGSFWCRCQC